MQAFRIQICVFLVNHTHPFDLVTDQVLKSDKSILCLAGLLSIGIPCQSMCTVLEYCFILAHLRIAPRLLTVLVEATLTVVPLIIYMMHALHTP